MRVNLYNKSIWGKDLLRRSMLMLVMVGLSTLPSNAQSLSQGLSAFSSATDGILPYIDSVRGMCYVLAACMSVVGAGGVCCQMLSETGGNIKKPIMSSVAACIMFVSLGTALPSFFGISSGSSASNSGGSDTSGYIDLNGKFRYDDWYAEKAPLSGWEVMNEATIAPVYRRSIWE